MGPVVQLLLPYVVINVFLHYSTTTVIMLIIRRYATHPIFNGFLTNAAIAITWFIFGIVFSNLYHSKTGHHGIIVSDIPAPRQLSIKTNLYEKITNDSVHNQNHTILSQYESLVNRGGNLSSYLASHIRVLCLILTTAKYHETRAVIVKSTWAKRCNGLVFISDLDDPDLPAIAISEYNDYDHVWSKVRHAFRWAYDNHLDDFDWFMKADDDTFVIMENFRALVIDHDSDKEDLYLGHPFGDESWSNPQSYTSGGSGYALSRKALKRLVEEAFPVPKYCKPSSKEGSEDVFMGQCLESIGITPFDTRDHIGRQRYLPLPPESHLIEGSSPKSMWIWSFEKYPYQEGEECCSSYAIAFHYVDPTLQQILEYLLYRLHPFGYHTLNNNDNFTLFSHHINHLLNINGYKEREIYSKLSLDSHRNLTDDNEN